MADKNLQFKIFASVVGAQSIDKLKGSVDGVNSSAKGLVGSLGGARQVVAGFAAALAGSAVVNYAKGILNTADNLDDLAQKTGVSASTLASFEGALKNADVSLEGFGKGVAKLSQQITLVKNGNEAAQKTFRAIGVSVTDANGQLKPTADIVGNIADAFQNLPDGPEKAAVAIKLFGKTGADLIPFLNQGSERIREFGLSISDDFAAKAGRFNDSLNAIGTSLKNGFISVLADVLPTLQATIDDFSSTSNPFGDLTVGFKSLGVVIDSVTQILDGFVTVFIQGSDFLIQSGRTLFEFLTAGFKTIGDTLFNVGVEIKNLASGNFDQLGSSIKGSIDRIPGYWDAAFAKNTSIINSWSDRSEKRLEGFFERTGNRASRISDALNGIEAPSEQVARPKAPTQQFGALADSEDDKKLESQLVAAEKFRQSQLGAIEVERRRLELAGETEEVQKREIALLEIKNEISERSKGQTAAVQQEYEKIGEEVAKARLELLAYEQQQKRSFSAGAKDAINAYLDQLNDVASQTKSAFSASFGALEDDLVNFAKTGKATFQDFANTVINELLKIAIRQAFIKPIVTGLGFGFADGGVMTSDGPLPLKKYANGGVANSPQLAIFGEGRTPEAYVPLPDGRNIPVKLDMAGAQGGVSNEVNVTVIMQSGGESQQSSESRGGSNLQAIGELIANKTREILVVEKRPGGLLA